MSVFDILKALESDNSRLAKEKILADNRKNEELKRAVFLALDSFTQFYIRKIPPYAPNKGAGKSLSWGMDQLKELSSRNVTGNDGIDHLKFILENVSETDAPVIERIIAKDLRCGVSSATANKTWPGIVYEFPCMLASGFEEKLVQKIKFPALAQLKLDGMRATVIVQDDKVTVYSRNGKVIDLGTHFDFVFTKLAGKEHVAFDGELLYLNKQGKPIDRKTGNGILNKAVKGTISQEEIKNVHIVLFDLIPLDDFLVGACPVPYSSRFDELVNRVSRVSPQCHHAYKLSIVHTQEVSSMNAAEKFFAKQLQNGEEGIILKTYDNLWENKRSKTQIKFKAELDCDLLCVDVEEGTGKNKGRLGALVLESGDGAIRVNVGTGFSDADREELWKNKPIGKIVAVCYNARIKDKNSDVESLFLPRFLEVREDKTKPDILS